MGSLNGQSNQLDVQGHAKIRGNLDIANMSDSTSIYLGKSAGLGADVNAPRSNTAVGVNAGNALIDGTRNSFFGQDAGASNTFGERNSFFGEDAGSSNSTGDRNSFFGENAGQSNNGTENSFFGQRSGEMNMNGGFNTFLGSRSGLRNTTGYSNVFTGVAAGQYNSSGFGNTFVGSFAGGNNKSGTRNTFIGYSSEQVSFNDSLDRAIAIGFNAKVDCHNCAVIGGTGDNAVKVGIGITKPSVALEIRNGGAPYSVGLTQRNLYTTGSAMEWTVADATNKSQVTRLGLEGNLNNFLLSYWSGSAGNEKRIALFGSDNQSTYGIWVSPDNQTPAYLNFRYNLNTVGGSVGYDSEDNLMKLVSKNSFTTSTFGLAIDLDGNVGINTEDPTEKLDINGNLRVRNVSSFPGGALYITGNGELTMSASDIRLKKEVSTLSNALDKTLALRGVTYRWLNPEYPQREIGLIAQEVEIQFPELVFTNPNTGYKGVKYAELVAVLVEAVKEQQSEIESLKSQVKELESLKDEMRVLKQIVINQMN